MNSWSFIARIILRNRGLLLSIIGVFIVVMAYYAPKAGISYHFSRVLPEDDTTSIEFAEFRKTFGNTGNTIIIAVDCGDSESFFKPEILKTWDALSDSINSIDGIKSTFSITRGYDVVVNEVAEKLEFVPIIDKIPETMEEALKFKEALQNLPFYKGVLFNEELSVFILSANVDEEVLNTKAITRIVRDIDKKINHFKEYSGFEAHVSGLPYVLFANAKKLESEIKMFITLTVLVTALILFLFLKSFRATAVSLVVVFIGVLTTFGLFGLFNFEISLVSSLIPPLVIVIGIPNCIYLINKYHSEYKSHKNKILSLQRVIRKIGYVTLLTNTTTALGFAAFILTDSITLVQFGVVTSINILIIFVLSIVIIPIIYSYLAPPKERHYKHLDRRWLNKLISILEKLVTQKRSLVYLITVVIISAGIYGISQLVTTGNMTDDFSRDDPVYQDLLFIQKHFKGVVPLEIVVDTKKKNGVQRLKTLKKINELQKRLENEPILSRSVSIVDFTKFAKQGFFYGNPDMYALPTRQERTWILNYLPDSGGNNLSKNMVDSTLQRARVSFKVADISTPEMKIFQSKLEAIIDDIFDPDDYKITITGASIKFLKSTSYLVKNLILSLALAIVVISVIMALLFGSARMVFISIVPNLIPLLLTGGLMGILGIPLKPSTILVFSIAFGISVDDTIHFLAKYRQELKINNWNISKSVILALRETGVSMFYTSIVLLSGFSIFMASEFGGSQALGLLVGITLFFAMFSNLVILPSFLMTMEKRINAKNFSDTIIVKDNDENTNNLTQTENKL